jgi:hypothetical protein
VRLLLVPQAAGMLLSQGVVAPPAADACASLSGTTSVFQAVAVALAVVAAAAVLWPCTLSAGELEEPVRLLPARLVAGMLLSQDARAPVAADACASHSGTGSVCHKAPFACV